MSPEAERLKGLESGLSRARARLNTLEQQVDRLSPGRLPRAEEVPMKGKKRDTDSRLEELSRELSKTVRRLTELELTVAALKAGYHPGEDEKRPNSAPRPGP